MTAQRAKSCSKSGLQLVRARGPFFDGFELWEYIDEKVDGALVLHLDMSLAVCESKFRESLTIFGNNVYIIFSKKKKKLSKLMVKE